MSRSRRALAVGALAAVSVLALAGCDAAYPEVDFAGPQVSAQRAAGGDEIGAALDGVASRAGFLHPAGSPGRRDECVQGQKNWKVDQPYAYTCTLQEARVYTFAGDFRQQAAAVGQALSPDPCPGGLTNTERVLRDYYDKLKGEKTGTLPEPYDAQYLPGSDAGCAGSSVTGRDEVAPKIAGWLRVPAQADDVARRSSEPWVRPCGSSPPWCEVEPLDLAAALGQAQEGDQWAVVLVASLPYLQADWA